MQKVFVQEVKVARTFTLNLQGNAAKASELIQRGNYGWVHRWITDERFPVFPHDPVSCHVELLQFKQRAAPVYILGEFKHRGLLRPTPEHVLYYGIQCPLESDKRPIVFLHETVQCPDRNYYVLGLNVEAGMRKLRLYRFSLGMSRRCRFAAVCPA